MATLGQRIKKLREGKGLSQGELGKLVNVGNTTISQWENDKRTPDLATLDKLANVLKTSSDYLLGRTDDPSPTNARQLPKQSPPTCRRALKSYLRKQRRRYSQLSTTS